MKPDRNRKNNIKLIMHSNVSLRSDNVWVRVVSFILITSFLLLLGAAATCLLQPAGAPNQAPRFSRTAAKPVEEQNIVLIKEYYALIADGNLAEAHALRAEGEITLAAFETMYKDVEYARPDRFAGAGENVYDFIVAYKDKCGEATAYGVRTAVSDGKLSVKSSREFQASFAQRLDYTAFATVRGDKNYLILEKGGQETIVDVGEYGRQAIDEGFNENFYDLSFSPWGNYLIYFVSQYESNDGRVYDIKGGLKVLDLPGALGSGDIAASPDDRYLFACFKNDFMGGVPGEVYAMPAGTKVFDASVGNEGYADSSCAYNEEEREIVFIMRNPNVEKSDARVVKYPLNK